MRHVLQRDVGVHLPEPGVLGGEGQGLSGPVALVGEDDLGGGQAFAPPDQGGNGATIAELKA